MGKYALVLCAWALSGCPAPTCGPGTRLAQTADGSQCVVDDDAGIPCDVDGGDVEIVDGKCVSKTKCDPGLLYDPVTGVCVIPSFDPCPNPVPAGQVCLKGGIVDFQTGQHVPTYGTARPLRISIVFLPCPAGHCLSAVPLAEQPATTRGLFTFVVFAPSSGWIGVAVSDPVGSTDKSPLVYAVASAVVVPGYEFNVDGYQVLQSTLDGWAAADARFASVGSYVGCFYKQPPPSATNFLFTETMPATGVQLLETVGDPSLVRYLKRDGTIDPMLTVTGVSGCALAFGDGSVGQISGTGGGVTKWETKSGVTEANTVFIERFHDCDGQPNLGACQ